MSNNSTCVLPPSFIPVKDWAYFIAFYICTPIYFFFAFTGHVLLLVGFVKRSKANPAYTYQIFLTIAKTVEIVFFTLFVLSAKWCSGIEGDRCMWFARNPVLMWIAAHAIVPMQNSCITTSLLVAVAMAGDRVFALWKPFQYQNSNQKTQQVVAMICCVFLGWSTSIFDWFRFNFLCNGDYYIGVVDKEYVGSVLAKTLANLRNALRTIGVIALISLNIAIIVLYRLKATGTQISKGGGSAMDSKRMADRKSTERSLIILVVSQSIAITLSISMFVIFYVIVYTVPSFSLCPEGILFACIMDAVLEMGDVVTFAVVLVVDRKMRRTINTALICNKNHVQPIEITDFQSSVATRTLQRSQSTRVTEFN